MAKETVYNNTLVSGAADETLTYTRYVKDESSGKSTKELLDEKVNKTDQLGTTQIADKAITTEKLENESVTTDKLDAASVTTDKVADANITTSKLADSSVETEKINNKAVTTDKLNDGAVDNSKLSPNAVTSEKIKDGSVITEKLNDRAVTTEKVEEKAITNGKIGDSAVDGRTISEASVEKKHLANDSVATEKLQDSSVTSDKIHNAAITEEKIKDSSVSNSKLADNSVGTSKIKDGNITNEKVANNTLTQDKLDPELRKAIQAATGLPENLVEVIQDVDKEVKTLHSKDTDLQSQITDKQQQITAHDKDIELLQTRSTQMEQTINNIAATGGASVANTVAYTNTTSGLESVNAQGAIDELAAKNKSQDATISGKAEKSDVQSAVSELKEKDSALSAEIAKKFDKESILQESGEAEDKVMSQKVVSDKLSNLSNLCLSDGSVDVQHIAHMDLMPTTESKEHGYLSFKSVENWNASFHSLFSLNQINDFHNIAIVLEIRNLKYSSTKSVIPLYLFVRANNTDIYHINGKVIKQYSSFKFDMKEKTELFLLTEEVFPLKNVSVSLQTGPNSNIADDPISFTFEYRLLLVDSAKYTNYSFYACNSKNAESASSAENANYANAIKDIEIKSELGASESVLPTQKILTNALIGKSLHYNSKTYPYLIGMSKKINSLYNSDGKLFKINGWEIIEFPCKGVSLKSFSTNYIDSSPEWVARIVYFDKYYNVIKYYSKNGAETLSLSNFDIPENCFIIALSILADSITDIVYDVDYSANLLSFFPIFNSLKIKEEKKIVTFVGDSITWMWGEDGYARRIEAYLNKTYPNKYICYNHGMHSRNAKEIAAVNGGCPLSVQADFTIPSDTSEVEIILSDMIHGSYNKVIDTNPYYIRGIKGNLKKSENGDTTYAFTRLESGNETKVCQGEIVISEACVHNINSYIMFIFAGTNNGMGETQAIDEILEYERKISQLSPNGKFIVISPFKKDGMSEGDYFVQQGYKIFGNKFIDLYNYFRKYAIADAVQLGYLEESDTEGKEWWQLFTDGNETTAGLHPSIAGAKLIEKLCIDRITELGYFEL